jgi:putative transposase
MANLLIDAIFHYRREQKFLIYEFVVMPNHIHMLLAPAGIALEKAMQLVKGGYSYRVKKELGARHGDLGTRVCGPPHSRRA